MNKSEAFWTEWKEMIHEMEMEIHAQEALLNVQREHIRSLEDHIRLLEAQKKKLVTAGNALSDQCEKLDQICISQQETLEEFREMFSELLKKQ